MIVHSTSFIMCAITGGMVAVIAKVVIALFATVVLRLIARAAVARRLYAIMTGSLIAYSWCSMVVMLSKLWRLVRNLNCCGNDIGFG